MIGQTVIRAPFSGIVTEVEAKKGEISSLNTPLVQISSEKDFLIEVFVTESNIAKVSLKDKAEVTLDAYGSEEVFEAQVDSISPGETALEGISTYKVELHFLKPDERLKKGMTANVEIKTSAKENVIQIPTRALIQKEDLRYVKVIRNDLIEETEVKTGLRGNDGSVEILSGLEEGERIIVFEKE